MLLEHPHTDMGIARALHCGPGDHHCGLSALVRHDGYRRHGRLGLRRDAYPDTEYQEECRGCGRERAPECEVFPPAGGALGVANAPLERAPQACWRCDLGRGVSEGNEPLFPVSDYPPQVRVVTHERLEPRAGAPGQRAEHVLGRQLFAQVRIPVRGHSNPSSRRYTQLYPDKLNPEGFGYGAYGDHAAHWRLSAFTCGSICSSAREATLEALQPPPHPRLDRAERLLHVARELRMRQAMEECEDDALALLGLQLREASR